MKNIRKTGAFAALLMAVMLLVAVPSFAQMVSNNNEDGVNKPTREARFRPYREGQVIVKFKTGSGVRVQKVKGKFKTSAVSAVDRVMNALGVADAETGHEQYVDTGHQCTREHDRRWWRESQEQIADLFKRCGVGSAAINTESGFVIPLMTLFARRG